jgi:hypothetical protein
MDEHRVAALVCDLWLIVDGLQPSQAPRGMAPASHGRYELLCDCNMLARARREGAAFIADYRRRNGLESGKNV